MRPVAQSSFQTWATCPEGLSPVSPSVSPRPHACPKGSPVHHGACLQSPREGDEGGTVVGGTSGPGLRVGCSGQRFAPRLERRQWGCPARSRRQVEARIAEVEKGGGFLRRSRGTDRQTLHSTPLPDTQPASHTVHRVVRARRTGGVSRLAGRITSPGGPRPALPQAEHKSSRVLGHG